MNIRTPRIGCVCSADPTDLHAVAHDFAYELRQFIITGREEALSLSASLFALKKDESCLRNGPFAKGAVRLLSGAFQSSASPLDEHRRAFVGWLRGSGESWAPGAYQCTHRTSSGTVKSLVVR